MERIITALDEFITSRIPTAIYGIPLRGERLEKPTFRTTTPKDQVDEFRWMKEFKVSSLHRVDQRVYF
jgi:hypothetical protein